MICPSSPAVNTVCSWSNTQKLRTSSDPWAPGSPTLVSALKPQAGDLAMWTSWKSCWLCLAHLRQHIHFGQIFLRVDDKVGGWGKEVWIEGGRKR